MSVPANDDDGVFRPYGLDPNDPYFDELLASNWAIDYNNAQLNMTKAREWYEREKAEFERQRAKKMAE